MSEMTGDLIRTVDRMCGEYCTKDLRQQAESGGWPAAFWQALDDVGLVKAAVPESAGGSGLDFEDAMAALRRVAWHAAPVPLAETMAAGRLLVAAGLPIPDGPITLAAGDAPLALDAAGRLRGTAHRVPWGEQCPHVVVAVERNGESQLVLARTGHTARATEKNLAGEPRVRLAFEGTPVVAAARLEGAQARLEAEGALFRSVQMAGALERLLEYSLQYANERVQFGRPIGKFQAVQHMLAQLAGHAAAASAAAHAAVEACRGQPDTFAVAVAKARTGEAAGKGCEIAHQVHGAMGYTREHNLHFSTRRLWSWRDEFGNETHWQTWIGRHVTGRGADALWPMLTGM